MLSCLPSALLSFSPPVVLKRFTHVLALARILGGGVIEHSTCSGTGLGYLARIRGRRAEAFYMFCSRPGLQWSHRQRTPPGPGQGPYSKSYINSFI